MPKTFQSEALSLYAGLMEEVKIRHESIERTVMQGSGLIFPLAKEYCWLQLRMQCELIALACLVAHGDLRIKRSSLQRTYSAELIMKELSNLHPDFYPVPVVLKVKPDGGLHLDDSKQTYLSKADLMTLCAKCGDKLHRGSIRKLLSPSAKPTPNFDDVVEWTNKIVHLLNHHKIALSDEGYLICILKDRDNANKARVAFARPMDDFPLVGK